MSRIIFATGNQNKMREIREIMQGFRVNGEEIEILSMKEAGVYTDIVEDGMTFVENASIKAKAIAVLAPGDFVMADDSGLEIDALNKEPGIYSARYAETPAKRIERVLKEMEGKTSRNAHFACCMTLINPNGEVEFSTTGICEGSITTEARGSNGFGYDPIFLVKGDTRTIAELSEDEKNQISHRSIALRRVVEYLKKD